jgi:hypothetical protein
MTERETLLAEIAAAVNETVADLGIDAVRSLSWFPSAQKAAQARLAELDREPDYEAWRPALEALYGAWHNGATANTPLSSGDHLNIRGLIAAFAKAPPMGKCQPRWPSYLQVEALARRVEGGVTNRVRLVAYEAAMEMANLLHEQMTEQQP